MINNMTDEEAKYIVHGWLFHFNCYTDEWNAFPRTELKEYFNGTSKSVVSDADYEKCLDKLMEKVENV